SDHGADRTGGSFAVSRAPLNPARDSLGLRHDGQRHDGGKGGNSDKAADHYDSNDVGWDM
ncbi:MAG: hypothetical protein WCA28_09305, partial [Bradyrhizobium sp.]